MRGIYQNLKKKKEKEINDPDFLTLILSGIGTSIRKYSI